MQRHRRSAPRDFYGAARRAAHKGDAAEIPGPRRWAHGAQNPNRNRPEASVCAESNTDVTPDLNGSLGPPLTVREGVEENKINAEAAHTHSRDSARTHSVCCEHAERAFSTSELSPQPPDMSSLSDSEKEQLQAAYRRRNAEESDATCGERGPAKRAAASAAGERTIGRGARIKNGATGGIRRREGLARKMAGHVGALIRGAGGRAAAPKRCISGARATTAARGPNPRV
ncbi:hypothetical protein MTO96_013105 [Rhipicephalus appendiculatus]